VTNPKPPPVHKAIVGQLLATALIAAASLVLAGTVTAYSVVLGGLVSILPNGYFAWQAFRYQGAGNARKVVKSFMKGEFGKLGMTLVLFALCFALITNLRAPALIFGFIAVHFTGVIMAAAVIGYRPTGHGT